jgi:hypothetical protein
MAAPSWADDGRPRPIPKGAVAWKPVARIDGDRLHEPSGIVASRRRPGHYWTHGDSGNEPTLFAVNTNGHVVAEVPVANAPNIDWEDIAADDAGHLYIGDIGNNLGILPIRYVYQVDEPDPLDPPKAPITPRTFWRFKYPKGAPKVNFESLAWRAGKLYIIAREMTGSSTLYEIVPGENNNAKLQPAAALSVPGASAIDFSADGTRLAVCSTSMLWVFPITERDGKLVTDTPKIVRFPLTRTLEGCCFTDDGVLMVDEERSLYRVSDKQIQAQTLFVP